LVETSSEISTLTARARISGARVVATSTTRWQALMLAVRADGPMPEAVPGLRSTRSSGRQGLAADAHDEQGRGASRGESECPRGLPSFLFAGDLLSLASSVRSRSAGRAPRHVDHGHRTRQPTWSIGTSRWARRGRRCRGPAGAWPPRRFPSDQTKGDQHVQPMLLVRQVSRPGCPLDTSAQSTGTQAGSCWAQPRGRPPSQTDSPASSRPAKGPRTSSRSLRGGAGLVWPAASQDLSTEDDLSGTKRSHGLTTGNPTPGMLGTCPSTPYPGACDDRDTRALQEVRRHRRR
jgi:hypothetical protein